MFLSFLNFPLFLALALKIFCFVFLSFFCEDNLHNFHFLVLLILLIAAIAFITIYTILLDCWFSVDFGKIIFSCLYSVVKVIFLAWIVQIIA